MTAPVSAFTSWRYEREADRVEARVDNSAYFAGLVAEQRDARDRDVLADLSALAHSFEERGE